ncbi:serine protease [Streptomyces sp. NPDC004267]|uniref:serine protease n=1 Tax=Streptomyces sp. NPDC004267 TaxID=3364694 RepID=UPI00369C84C0
MNESSAHSSAPKSRRTVLRGLAATATVAVTATALTSGATATAATKPAAGAVETYTLKLVHLGRTGAPTTAHRTQLTALSGPDAGSGQVPSAGPSDPAGTVTVRVPKGRYLLDSTITTETAGGASGVDWLVRPRLDVDRDTTLVLDARTARPVDVLPPDAGAAFRHAGAFVEVAYQGTKGFANLITPSSDLRVAHLGPATERGAVRAWIDTYWNGQRGTYVLGYTFTSDRALTGLVRHPAAAELGTIVVRAAAPASGPGYGFVDFGPTVGPSPALASALQVPGSATYMVTPERGTWDVVYTAPTASDEETPNRYFALGTAVAAGGTTVLAFDTPVFGPALATSRGAKPAAVRTGNTLAVALPLLADGAGNVPSAPPHSAATTTLHRNGSLVGTRRGTPGHASFTVPAGRASYRLTATAKRPRGSVTAAWTFTSAATGSTTELPLSIVRFAPSLGPDGTAAPRRADHVGVTVRGAAERSGVRSLTVSVSADGGATWTPVPVRGGRVAVTNPGPGRSVSLRAELTDSLGNTLTQTHIDAYTTGQTAPRTA